MVTPYGRAFDLLPAPFNRKSWFSCKTNTLSARRDYKQHLHMQNLVLVDARRGPTTVTAEAQA